APRPSGAFVAGPAPGNTHVLPATVLIEPAAASELKSAEVTGPRLGFGFAAVITRTSSLALEFDRCSVTVRRSADRMAVSVGLPSSSARTPFGYEVPRTPTAGSIAVSVGSRTITPNTSVGKVTPPASNCTILLENPTGSACR